MAARELAAGPRRGRRRPAKPPRQVQSALQHLTVAALYARPPRRQQRGHRSGDAPGHLVGPPARPGRLLAGRWSPLLDREAGQPRLYACVETPAATCRHRLDGRSSKHSRGCRPMPRCTTPTSGRACRAVAPAFPRQPQRRLPAAGAPTTRPHSRRNRRPRRNRRRHSPADRSSAAPPSLRSRTGRCR